MKLLSFTILSLFSFTATAVEFQNCIDKNGVIHYTNLPSNSLKSDCSMADYHSLMLKQDFQNLSIGYSKFNNVLSVNPEPITSTPQSDSSEQGTSDQRSIQNKISDLLDPDIALDEMLSNSEKNDDSVIMERFKARSTAVEDITNQ